MAADVTSTPAVATEEYEFLSESLASEREIVRNEGLRGTRLHPVERIRQGRMTPGGTIEMEPTYADLVNLLPRAIAAAVAGAGFNTYTVGDTALPYFQTIIYRVASLFTYTQCKINRTTFRGSIGQPLKVSFEVEALNETKTDAGSFPVLTIAANAPFIFTDSTAACVSQITLGGTAYQIQELECTVDWHLKTDRFMNSQTRTDLVSLDLTIPTRFVVPFTSDTVALYDNAGAVSGIAAAANFTYLGAGGGAAGVNLKFTFGNLVFPARKSPVVPNRDEITMTLEGEARKTGATAPLVVQLDSTP